MLSQVIEQTRPKRAAFSEFRLLLITSVMLSALSYVTNIFLANRMGPEIFGHYSYALVLGALFGQLINFGTAEAGIQLKTSHGNAALNWILTVKALNFALLLFGVLVSLALDSALAALFGMIVALNALSFTTNYEAQGQNVRYAVIFLVERVIITAALWVGLLTLESGHLVWIFGTLFLVQWASLIFQYWENRQYRLSFELGALFKTYRDGFFVLVFSLSKFAFGGITRILIFNQLGDTQMGIFSTAWQFVPLSTLYFTQAIKTWRLRITEALIAQDATTVRRHILALSAAVFLPTLLASVVLVFFGHQIIALLFTEAFTDAGRLMPYLGVYFLVVSLDSIALLLAIAMSMSRTASAIYVIFGSLTVLSCLFLMDGRGLEVYLVAIIAGHFGAAAALTIVTTQAIRRMLR